MLPRTACEADLHMGGSFFWPARARRVSARSPHDRPLLGGGRVLYPPTTYGTRSREGGAGHPPSPWRRLPARRQGAGSDRPVLDGREPEEGNDMSTLRCTRPERERLARRVLPCGLRPMSSIRSHPGKIPPPNPSPSPPSLGTGSTYVTTINRYVGCILRSVPNA